MDKGSKLIVMGRFVFLFFLFISEPAISSEKLPNKGFQSAIDIVRQLAPGHQKAFSSSNSPTVDLQVNFKLNSNQLSKTAKQQLNALGEALNNSELKDGNFIIAGHTDASGSKIKNQDLSQKRAQAVVNFLTTHFKINPKQLSAIGYGETQLRDSLNPNSATNRRVEVQLIQDPLKDSREEKIKW
jgi:outer membrane protein OmpA-like peptidoglycan-associated protein